MTIEKVVRKLENVLASIAKRRHLNIDAVQPVVQIGSEPPLRNQRGQRTIRRDNDSRVDAARAMAAHPLDRQILNCPQQFRLRGWREIRYFVEKQCPFMRKFELASAAPYPSGGSIFDAEELGLEKRFDDRRAIHRYERRAPAPAQFVDLTSDELFA